MEYLMAESQPSFVDSQSPFANHQYPIQRNGPNGKIDASQNQWPSQSKSKTRSKHKSQDKCHFDPIEAACGPPTPQPPLVYRPDRGCYEKVKGPFKNPIPTRYQRCTEKFRKKCCPCQPAPNPPKNKVCCDDIRKYKACCTELQRLREEELKEKQELKEREQLRELEMWKANERKNILHEKDIQEKMEHEYKAQLEEWQQIQGKCERDRERRKMLLKYLVDHRKELKKIKIESRLWRQKKQELLEKQQREQDDIWVQEYAQREDELRWEKEKMQMFQENRLLQAQMKDRDSTGMEVPELEEMRRMFAPVDHGPKETFEYYLLDPHPEETFLAPEPTYADIPYECEQPCSEGGCSRGLGIGNEHGICLNLANLGQKKVTVKLAMGPKNGLGCQEQTCNPPAACNNENTCCTPNPAPAPPCADYSSYYSSYPYTGGYSYPYYSGYGYA